jgi:hypothetical protein
LTPFSRTSWTTPTLHATACWEIREALPIAALGDPQFAARLSEQIPTGLRL